MRQEFSPSPRTRVYILLLLLFLFICVFIYVFIYLVCSSGRPQIHYEDETGNTMGLQRSSCLGFLSFEIMGVNHQVGMNNLEIFEVFFLLFIF